MNDTHISVENVQYLLIIGENLCARYPVKIATGSSNPHRLLSTSGPKRTNIPWNPAQWSHFGKSFLVILVIISVS